MEEAYKRIRGANQYQRFRDGQDLTRKQAMEAMCYDCLGGTRMDCLGTDCPMYQFRPHKEKQNATDALGACAGLAERG